MRFGFATDTYDCTGEAVGPRSDSSPNREELEAALEAIPRRAGAATAALFSEEDRRKAIPSSRPRRHRGEAHGREGGNPRASARRFRAAPRAAFALRFERHVRPLAQPTIWARSSAVERTSRSFGEPRIGPFTVEEASTLEDLSRLAHQKRLSERLVSPAELPAGAPSRRRVHRRGEASGSRQGRARGNVGRRLGTAGLPGGPIRVCGEGGELVSVAHVHGARARSARTSFSKSRASRESPRGVVLYCFRPLCYHSPRVKDEKKNSPERRISI